jgi:hypothetical protein
MRFLVKDISRTPHPYCPIINGNSFIDNTAFPAGTHLDLVTNPVPLARPHYLAILCGWRSILVPTISSRLGRDVSGSIRH